MPLPEFTPDGPGDEVDDLDEKQHDAEKLEGHVVDEQRDPREQDQAIDPGAPGEGAEPAQGGSRQALGWRIAESEKGLANEPSPDRERA